MSNIERRKLIPKTPPTERFSKIPKLKKFLFTLATTTVLLLPFSSQVLATSKPKKINL